MDDGIITLNGKQFPLYVWILHEAHEKGLLGIHTELVQIPDERNGQTAIVKALVRMSPMTEGGPERIFEDFGDANPRNTNARVATALCRMASTRAKGRALRDAIDCGHTMAEELADVPEEPGGTVVGSGVARMTGSDRTPAVSTWQEARGREGSTAGGAAAAAQGVYTCSADGCGKALTKGQYDVSTNKYSRALCPNCQREAEKEAQKSGDG